MDLGSTKARILAAMAVAPTTCSRWEASDVWQGNCQASGRQMLHFSRGGRLSYPRWRGPRPRRLAMGESLARAVGALPLVVDAERQGLSGGHAEPPAVSALCSLVSTTDATTSSDPLVWQILASGFRDTSRVAGSDVTMMLDILLTESR